MVLQSPFKRLIKYGFFNDKGKSEFENLTPEERERKLMLLSDEKALEMCDVEYAEESFEIYIPTEFPQSLKRYWLAVESQHQNPETFYNWFHHQMSLEQSLQVEKIIDNYAASEASSFFGMMQQRLSIQQGNVSNFLKGISDMVKGLFQIVREIRIISDRLQYYTDTYEQNENTQSSEIVLKGLWVDQVEGGTKNPASIYGLAQQVGFTILPDIFFRISLKGPKEVDEKVEKLEFNEKVKEVLKRKLRQYYEWKVRTFKELETRKKFELKYLKQHYETIKLYISWIKPYLRYINRMQQLEKLEKDPRIVKSFEGAFIEIETLGKRKRKGAQYNTIVLATITHRTRPETLIHQPHEYQQKAPLHMGRSDIKVRLYTWTDEQLENYKKYRQEEDLALLSSIDESIKEAMDSLGDELRSYLGLEGEAFGDERRVHDLAQNLISNNISRDFESAIQKAKTMIGESKKKPKPTGALDPFVSVFQGVFEIFGALGVPNVKTMKKPKKKKEDPHLVKKDKQKAEGDGRMAAYLIYKNYKKSHKMITW
ncbi:hypothetical protein GOV08_02125 [Candidatus Woesearchaeota archaeon]|nr:hypothetical protein [Candidatus Woesearchaeota archaeon]